MTDEREEATVPAGDVVTVVRRANGWFLAVLAVLVMGGVVAGTVWPSGWPAWLAVVVVASLVARTVMVRAVRRGLDRRTGTAGAAQQEPR